MVWLSRDLRVHDHPALRAALDGHASVVAVFCFDERLLHGRHASGPRTQFLLESLSDLSERAGGRSLVLRRGPPERELIRLARGGGRRRGARQRRRRGRSRAAARSACAGRCATPEWSPGHPGHRRGRRPHRCAHPGGQALHRVQPLSPELARGAAPRAARTPRASCPQRRADWTRGSIPTLASLGLEQEVRTRCPVARRAGRERLAASCATAWSDYTDNHDALGRDKTSRLSPYLHFGCLSPREIEERLPRRQRGPTRSGGSSAGATSTITSCASSRGTLAPSSRSATAARSAGATPSSASRPGARGAPAIRWWTRACASCAARAGCTTGRGWWRARF